MISAIFQLKICFYMYTFYSEITTDQGHKGPLIYPWTCSLILYAYPALSCVCGGHILLVSLTGEDEDQYEQFMLPLTAAFEAVAQMFSTNSFNEQEAKVSPSPSDWSASG